MAIGILILAAVVAASPRRSRSEQPGFDPVHPVWRWQGPFEYVREYGTSAPGCAYRGRESVTATLVCAGSDLRHLRCTAVGAADHSYRESVEAGGAHSERSDSGTYQGTLSADYDTHTTKGVDLFRLEVGANLPVQYRRAEDNGAKTGKYLLDVTGSTRDLVFEPQNARLERRRVEPIYEPGPAACGVQGRFNGTETVTMRLLPVE